ncbi:MAG: NUDIX domain-containing protein [Patescibacteria group bacterium]
MGEPHIENKDTYFVAVKIFLERDGRFLIMKDKWGSWDLPGGRIKKDEFEVPLQSVIARKMTEEVGPDITYQLGKPEILMRHERVEAATGQPVRIFAVGYRARCTGGEPRLSNHHTEHKWVDPKTFKPEDYFEGGWLKGVQEYLKLEK